MTSFEATNPLENWSFFELRAEVSSKCFSFKSYLSRKKCIDCPKDKIIFWFLFTEVDVSKSYVRCERRFKKIGNNEKCAHCSLVNTKRLYSLLVRVCFIIMVNVLSFSKENISILGNVERLQQSGTCHNCLP